AFSPGGCGGRARRGGRLGPGPGRVFLFFFIFCPGEFSDTHGSPDTPSSHKTSDPVELYVAPPAPTVGRLQSGAARYMTDRAKVRTRPGAQRNVASDGYRIGGHEPGCDC